MPAALGPRFVLEAGFLILLAVVVGIADLSPALIILVMAVAWLLVAMIEYFAWRQGPGFSRVTRQEAVAERPPAPLQEEVVEDVAPPPPPPPPPSSPPPPSEEETIIAPAEASEAEPERPAEFRVEPQERARYSLEPLQPRPRRRWVVFGPRERPDAPPEGASEEER
jgi:uncharacterized protein (DUF58 family)